jgi:DNA-directed RNA polymerase specialized sigma24 family protein
MKREEDDPLIKHYSKIKCDPLTPDEAASATFDERFNSIAHFVITQVKNFYFSLSREGRVSYTVDDIFSDVWVELAEKNEQYDSSRGGYLIFASRIIRNHLVDMRERSRCVRLPSNATSTMKKYSEALEAGELKEAQKSILLSILAAARDHVELICIGDDLVNEPSDPSVDPHEELERFESEEEMYKSLSARLDTLTTIECAVLGASMGLWGSDALASGEVAFKYGADVKFVNRTLRRARRKLGIKARP